MLKKLSFLGNRKGTGAYSVLGVNLTKSKGINEFDEMPPLPHESVSSHYGYQENFEELHGKGNLSLLACILTACVKDSTKQH